MQIWPLCQRIMGKFLLAKFLMAFALVPTSMHISAPMELIKTKRADPIPQMHFALAASENEMPDKKPIELPVSRFPEPECSYQVHLDSATGPLVDRIISIGEKLYHKWDCAYNEQIRDIATLKNSYNNSLYCMMVHSCTISSAKQLTSNNRRKRHRLRRETAETNLEIVDEFGCAIYTNITPEIAYLGDLSAVLEVQAFALDYDQAAVFFKCNVRLLLKMNGRCRRPYCIKNNK